MTSSVQQHRDEAPQSVHFAVLTVSDTRTLETDISGATIVAHMIEAGHHLVDRQILPDEPEPMRALLHDWKESGGIDAVLITGGTGVTRRDQTYETVSDILTKPMPGFGEIFRMLSYAEIGPAAILSRAIGGLMGQMVILVMPGSEPAVRLALEKIILPELPHFVREARK